MYLKLSLLPRPARPSPSTRFRTRTSGTQTSQSAQLRLPAWLLPSPPPAVAASLLPPSISLAQALARLLHHKLGTATTAPPRTFHNHFQSPRPARPSRSA